MQVLGGGIRSGRYSLAKQCCVPAAGRRVPGETAILCAIKRRFSGRGNADSNIATSGSLPAALLASMGPGIAVPLYGLS